MDFTLEPWDERAPALQRRANTPEMMTYLGGPEPEAALADRHERIQRMLAAGTGYSMMIIVPGSPDPVGWVGCWDSEWQGQDVYEMGWSVVPEFQGRGLAAGAIRAVLDLAAADGRHRWVHAFPRLDNGPSNGACRKAGFELAGECVVEFPPGHPERSNDWRYDLTSLSGSASGSGATSNRA
jgi:RimJ/RimL family protein N-acetyltransferase